MLVTKGSYRNTNSLVELLRVVNSRESHSEVVQTRERKSVERYSGNGGQWRSGCDDRQQPTPGRQHQTVVLDWANQHRL